MSAPECHRTGRPSPARPCSWWGLQSRPGHPGRWCALTAPFHPYLCATKPAGPEGRAIGGLLSVALSCGSPRLGVTQHHALWSPDVPRPRCEHRGRGHPANSLPSPGYERAQASVDALDDDARAEDPAEHAERGGDDEVAEDLSDLEDGRRPGEQRLVLVAQDPDQDAHGDP